MTVTTTPGWSRALAANSPPNPEPITTTRCCCGSPGTDLRCAGAARTAGPDGHPDGDSGAVAAPVPEPEPPTVPGSTAYVRLTGPPFPWRRRRRAAGVLRF